MKEMKFGNENSQLGIGIKRDEIRGPRWVVYRNTSSR